MSTDAATKAARFHQEFCPLTDGFDGGRGSDYGHDDGRPEAHGHGRVYVDVLRG